MDRVSSLVRNALNNISAFFSTRPNLRWILATALALVAGTTIGLWVITSLRASQPVLFVLNGLIAFIPLFVCQWLLLRYYGRDNVWWIAVGIAAILIYALIASLFTSLFRTASPPLTQFLFRISLPVLTIAIFISGSVFGLLLGTFQWLVLRRMIYDAVWWIPTCVLSFGAGVAVSHDVNQLLQYTTARVGNDVSYAAVLFRSFVSNSAGALVISCISTLVLIYLLQRTNSSA